MGGGAGAVSMRRALQVLSVLLGSTDRRLEGLRGSHGGHRGAGVAGGEKTGGGPDSPTAALRRNSGAVGVRVGDSGSGSFLGSRRSSSGARRGRGGGVAGPRRSRAWRSRAAWGWRLGLEGAGGPRAAFIGRRGALGVRARAGNHGVSFAGDRGRFPLRGRAAREEEDGADGWARAGRGRGACSAGCCASGSAGAGLWRV